MTRGVLCCVLACMFGCGDDTDPDRACDFTASVTLEAHASALQSDGGVTLSGGVRFAPLVGGSGAAAERAVYAVYVADLEVQPAADEFNFRTWSIKLTADQLAAFTTTSDDGSKQARLSVRAYLHGGCVVELPEAEQPVVAIAEPTR